MTHDEDLLAMSPAEEARLFAKNNEREAKLYGDLLDDMRFLRRRGFGVWWVGDKLNVGNKLLTRDEFKAMAERHRNTEAK